MRLHGYWILFLSLSMLLVACGRETPVEPVASLSPLAEAELTMGAPGGCQHMKQHYMTTTSDDGASFIAFPSARQQTASMTYGMAALDDAGMLVMYADRAFWASQDDGCSWRQLRVQEKVGGGQLSAGPAPEIDGLFRVTSAGGGYAYAWESNGKRVYRIQHTLGQNVTWEVVRMRNAYEDMKGFAVSASDPLKLRTAGNLGQIYESTNGAVTWSAVGVPASQSFPLGYVVAFDANDLNHAVYGRANEGSYVTFDGGQSWTQATGLSASQGEVNLFNAVISPVDGNRVYAMGLDKDQGGGQHPSNGRHIYASNDGGLSYSVAWDHGTSSVYLTNGPFMLADPWDADRLTFLSTASALFGGTHFYVLDYANGGNDVSLSWNHSDQIPKVRVLVPSRLNPGSLHVGFDWF